MKHYSCDTIFKNPWEQVMVAVWQRYPNPYSRHVLSEDVISRRVQGALLITKRLLIKTNPIPKWGQRFVHLRHVPIVEESILDRDQRILITYTRNLGYTTTLNVSEKCKYEPTVISQKDGEVTRLKREAWIQSHVRGFSKLLKRFGIERYKHNSNNASKGLNYALSRLFPPTSATKSNSFAHPITDLVVHKKLECRTIKTPI